jgi:predicted metalloprotease
MGFSRVDPAHVREHRARITHRRLLMTGAVCATLAVAGCGSSGGQIRTTFTTTGSQGAAALGRGTPILGFHATGSKLPATATLAALPQAEKGVLTQVQGVAGQPLNMAITVVNSDINGFWGELFNKAGLQWPAMRQSLISSGTATASDCQGDTTIAATDPWRLCDSATGGTFYFPLPWVGQNVATDRSGVNLLLGTAELWSNHVENLLGVTQAVQNGKITPANYAEINVCLAGVYAYSVNGRQLLQAGDQQTFQNWYQRMSPEFTDVSAKDVSSQQLQTAFAAGLKSGSPSACLPSKGGASVGGGGGGGGGGGTTSQTATQTSTQTVTKTGTQTVTHAATQPPSTQTQAAGGGTGTIPLGGLSTSGG